MNKHLFKKIFFCVLSFTGITSTVLTIRYSNEETKTFAYENYTIDNFVTCDNWYNSGKGFALDFTYDSSTVTSDMTTTFSLLSSINDARVTNYEKFYFYSDGTVKSSIGKVVNRGDYYTFFVMFNEFKINTSEGALGSETVKKMNLRWVGVKIEHIESKLIDTMMIIDEKGTIRDEKEDSLSGLEFVTYMPKINDTSRYGMAIVPNEYISNLTSKYLETFTTQGKKFVKTYCTPLATSIGEGVYEKYGSGYFIKASLGNIKESNYMRDFTPVAFEETITGVVKYAFNIIEVKDNLYNVSYRDLNEKSLSVNAKAFANKVVSAIETRPNAYSTENIVSYIANNTDQIMKNADYTSSETTLSYIGAKGENEGAQLILKTNNASSNKIYVGISNLKNGKNIIENSNVEIKYELYQNVATNWSSTKSHTSYLSYLYPNGYETLATGYYPDALMPIATAVRSNSNVISPTNGNNQGLYIKINIPAEAVSGTYSGKLIVYIEGEGLITIPVSLLVNDFSLEGRKDANTIMNIDRTQLASLYGDKAKFNDMTNMYLKSAVSYLGSFGVSGGMVPEYCSQTEHLDGYIKALKEYLLTSKSKSYLLPFNSDKVTMTWTYQKTYATKSSVSVNEDIITSDTNDTRLGLKDILTALVEASTNEFNLLEGACIYDPHADEPSADADYIRNILNYNSIRKSIDYVVSSSNFTGKTKVLASLKGLTYIMTCGPENNKFYGSYGIHVLKSVSNVSGATYCSCSTKADITYKNLSEYCPNIMWNQDNSKHSGSGYCWDALKKVYDGTDTSTRVWEYSCIQPVSPYPSYIINAPMIRSRANRWRQFGLGIQGEFYYMSIRTNSFYSSVSTPCSEEEILDGKASYEGAYGDGLLMYPVHDTYGYTDRNLYYFSSLRLENIGEGNDDLKYLNYTEELIKDSKDVTGNMAILKGIIESLCTSSYKPTSITKDASTFISARNNLISLINNLAAEK